MDSRSGGVIMGWDWESYVLALPSDRERVEYLAEEMRRRDRSFDGLAEEFRQEFGMTPQQSRICARLMQSLGHVVPYEFLIVAMHSEDSIDPRNQLGVQLFTIRSKLQGSRIWIDTDHGVGLRMMCAGPLFRSPKVRAGSIAPTGPSAGANYHISKISETERKDP